VKKQLELEQLKLRRAQQRAGVTLNPNPKPQTLQPRVWGEKIHSLHMRHCDNHTTKISSSPFSKLLGPRLSSLCGKKQISQIFENISSLPFWQLLGPRLSVLCGKKQISQKNNEHISPFPFWLLLGPRLSSLYGD